METLLNSPIATEFDLHTLPFTPSDPLLNSVGINHFDMIRILHDNCPEFARALNTAKVQNIKAVDICEGRGFLSHILRTTFQFVDTKQPSYSFVIKVPQSETYDAIVDSYSGSAGSLSESESSSTINEETSSSSICSTHDSECDFYELFHQSSSLALPEVYYVRRNTANHKGGMIYMQDLSSQGACVDVFSSLTIQQCKNVAIEIARLQAHFDFMPKEQTSVITSEECAHTSSHKQQFLDEFLSKIGAYGEDFTILLKQLNKFANTQFAQYALIDRVKQEGCTTLCHGDLWTNNVLFRKSKDHKSSDEKIADELCAVIDWQTAFQGNPLFDLSFLLASSTDSSVRREAAGEVVDLYFDTLTNEYKQRGAQLNLTRTQAHQLFKLCQIQQAPVLGALMCFFGHKMEMNCPDKDFLNAKMSVICERTKQVMRDAVDYVEELGLQNFDSII